MLLCDSGPLVAAGLSRDPDHHACVELFTSMHLAGRPMLVPAPVVAEVGYLLQARGSARAEAAFLRSVAAGDLHLVDLVPADFTRMADLVETYADLPLGTTDAAVITLASGSGSPRSPPSTTGTSPWFVRGTPKLWALLP